VAAASASWRFAYALAQLDPDPPGGAAASTYNVVCALAAAASVMVSGKVQRNWRIEGLLEVVVRCSLGYWVDGAFPGAFR
jgi:hypothetical protein